MIKITFLRPVLIIIMILTIVQLMALPVIINGKSSAGNAFVFRVYQEADPISGVQILLDQERPNESGVFMLGFEAKSIKEVTIKVGLQSMSFYVTPGKTYHLDFNKISLEDQNIFLPEKPLQVLFLEEDMLNIYIDGFEYQYQNFIEDKFVQLIKFRDRSLYYSFEKKIFQLLNETSIEDSITANYFKKYLDYRLAELRLAARIDSKEQLGIDWLTNHEIDFSNTAYSHFFMKYFDQYIIEFDNGKLFNDYRTLVNQGVPYDELFDQLGKNPVLVKEKIREVVFLSTLKQVFYRRDMSQVAINKIIVDISIRSKFKENREIAMQLSKSLNAFVSGRSVPYFSLPDANGKSKSLTDYKGKMIYLMFVSPNCETCEADLRILSTLLNENENLDILTIVSGYDRDESMDWAKKQNTEWDYLWFNDDFALLNEYKIKTFPKYLLLDDEGSLLNYFPPKPRENLKSYLESLEKQKEKPKQESSDFFRKN